MILLVLMAGDSGAFAAAGHRYPKNLVEIEGLPLAQRVIDGLTPLIEQADRSVFLVSETEDRKYHTADMIRLLVPNAVVIPVPPLESGAACTVLHAIAHVVREEPLMVVNGDQVIDVDWAAALSSFRERSLDGGVITFDAVHPRWSFVRCDADGHVVEAAEKRPISRLATAGAYWFRRGGDCIEGIMAMIRKDASVDGRFYVCPVYNELVLRHRRVGTFHVERERYFSLSTPQGVAAYEERLQQRRRAEALA